MQGKVYAFTGALVIITALVVLAIRFEAVDLTVVTKSVTVSLKAR